MVKLKSDIWSNSNTWSKLLPIYAQSQTYMVKFYMIKLKYMVKPKLWSNSYNDDLGKLNAHIWSNMQQIYGQNSGSNNYHNSHGYDDALGVIY